MNINSLLSRLGLFVATAVVGAFVTSTITAILTPTKLDSAARTVPQVVSTPGPGSSGETVFAAFDLIPASPEPLEAVDAPILQAIAAQQPEPEPNPNGLPRVPAVSQFDGTPFAGGDDFIVIERESRHLSEVSKHFPFVTATQCRSGIFYKN